MARFNLIDFLAESNRIEGIETSPSAELVAASHRFLALPFIGVGELVDLVGVIQPDAVLRDQRGLDVRVGNHHPPPGGPEIRDALDRLLFSIDKADPYRFHVEYETLHPFTDGNGRSGRMLWLWQMWRRVPKVPPLGFLHHWYYQSLDGARKAIHPLPLRGRREFSWLASTYSTTPALVATADRTGRLKRRLSWSLATAKRRRAATPGSSATWRALATPRGG